MKLFLKIIFFVLFSAVINAQNIPLKFEIDSIAINNLNPEKRIYSIHYHIQNLTNQPVSFFLMSQSLIANAASSMSLFPVYHIYQNEVVTELDGPFFESFSKNDFLMGLLDPNDVDFKNKALEIYKKAQLDFRSKIDIYKKNGGKSDDESWIIENQRLLESKIVLQPNETKNIAIQTTWDKKRYYKQDNIEYYLNENDNYKIELTFNLMKTLLKNRFSPEEYKAIENDKNCIQGVFKSNKIEIDFKN